MLKVPPAYSSSRRVPLWARSIRSLLALAISTRDFSLTSADGRHDKALLQSYRNPYIEVGIELQMVVLERGVEVGELLKSASRCLDYHVVDTYPRAIPFASLGTGL